jgi:putative sterol carrier protein
MPVTSARDLFDRQMPERLKAKPEIAQKVNAIYKFVVTGEGGGTWTVDLTQPGGKVSESDGEAQCTISIGAKELIAVVNGKLNAQMAFMTGKLKVAGDIGLALKLGSLLS